MWMISPHLSVFFLRILIMNKLDIFCLSSLFISPLFLPYFSHSWNKGKIGSEKKERRADYIWLCKRFGFFYVAQMVKKPPAMQENPRSNPGVGRSPGGGHGIHSSILAWRIPWTEEPGRLQSMGSWRVGRDWEMKHKRIHERWKVVRARNYCFIIIVAFDVVVSKMAAEPWITPSWLLTISGWNVTLSLGQEEPTQWYDFCVYIMTHTALPTTTRLSCPLGSPSCSQAPNKLQNSIQGTLAHCWNVASRGYQLSTWWMLALCMVPPPMITLHDSSKLLEGSHRHHLA